MKIKEHNIQDKKAYQKRLEFLQLEYACTKYDLEEELCKNGWTVQAYHFSNEFIFAKIHLKNFLESPKYCKTTQSYY